VGVDDTPALMSKVTDDAPLILMVHEPDVFAGLDARASLTLAGHMHAGQIRVCGYSPYLPSRFGSRYLYGHIVEQGRHMIVSGGLGCSRLPIRLGAPPEIVIVELGETTAARQAAVRNVVAPGRGRAAMLVQLDPPAVEFDLVQLLLTAWWGVA
jgi:hypothetical protein